MDQAPKRSPELTAALLEVQAQRLEVEVERLQHGPARQTAEERRSSLPPSMRTSELVTEATPLISPDVARTVATAAVLLAPDVIPGTEHLAHSAAEVAEKVVHSAEQTPGGVEGAWGQLRYTLGAPQRRRDAREMAASLDPNPIVTRPRKRER